MALADIAEFPGTAGRWQRDYQTGAMRRPMRIDLGFLRELTHGEALVRGFWSRFGRSNFAGATLESVAHDLRRWAEFCQESGQSVKSCGLADENLLRSFVAWAARRNTTRHSMAGTVGTVIECLAAGADGEEAGRGEALRAAKSSVLLSCRANGRENRNEGKALADDDWQRLLTTARSQAEAAMASQRAGDTPASGTQLVPFLVLVAAYTGANPYPLLAFRRDAWKPEPVLDGYWRVSWRKDRAAGHEEQSLVFAAAAKEGPSLIELLNFVRKWTEPLTLRVAASCRDDLWLHRSRKYRVRSAAWAPSRFISRHVHGWMKRQGMPVTLDRLRPSAALTLLRAGQSLPHVQSFLQHSDLRTTWRYVRSEVLRPAFDRQIAATQERILGLVVASPRAAAASAVEASAPVRKKLAGGEWDLGTCACRDPYNSPVEGEVKGRLCRSFHACYFCPHAVWFREHLPLEVWKLRRFESLKASDPHWETRIWARLRDYPARHPWRLRRGGSGVG